MDFVMQDGWFINLTFKKNSLKLQNTKKYRFKELNDFIFLKG